MTSAIGLPAICECFIHAPHSARGSLCTEPSAQACGGICFHSATRRARAGAQIELYRQPLDRNGREAGRRFKTGLMLACERFFPCALWVASGGASLALDLGEEIEEGVDALAQLGFNLFAGAFEQVHGHPGSVAVPEFDGRVTHPCYFLGGKQTQTIDKSQIRHSHHLIPVGSERVATEGTIEYDIAMTDTARDTVILGSGCAGLTAAIYAARANLKPLVIEGHEPGGQLSITTLVENFPGWPEGIQGPQLIENMKLQAARFGAEFRMGHLVSADLSKHPFELKVGSDTIHTRTLIIASGASARWLGLPSEQALIGHGVSSCATCDGFFFSGKEIAVIGGGDSAMEEALFLTRFASKVALIHRRGEFRASKIMLDRARKHEQIQFLTDTVVDDVYDVNKKEVTGLRLRNVKTGEQWDFPTSAMFLGIGHTPNAQFVGEQLKRDGEGYLIPEGYVLSRVPGVFISGDVADRRYRQAVTAAGTGCMAALEVEKYLEEIGK